MSITKAELRKKLTGIRLALSPADVVARSSLIAERLLQQPEMQRAQSVFVYVSHGKEVETHDLIRTLLQEGRTVAVPRITGPGTMDSCRIERWEDLAPGTFGILAPRAPCPQEGSPEVTICPGLGFTRRGDRLGRGRAYYDRYLSGHPDTFVIALSFDEQIVDEIPTSEMDRPVHMLITERCVYRVEPRGESGDA